MPGERSLTNGNFPIWQPPSPKIGIVSAAVAPFSAAIIFLRDQPAIPAQQGLRRDNRSHLSASLLPNPLALAANRRHWSSLKRNRWRHGVT
jgi:hypothetical protein